MDALAVWSHEQASSLLGNQLARRWSHVQGVAARASIAVPLFGEQDGELLVSAALLHDIGYSPAISKLGFHALDGAVYLEQVNAPRRLCALVAHHSCAYKEAEIRGLSASLATWVDEETSLRDALWWADMTTSPDGELVTVDERLEEIQDRYGPQDIVTFFIQQAESELRGAVRRTAARLRAAGISYE